VCLDVVLLHAVDAAFEHQDQAGFNVILQALPIDGKIVWRPPKSDTKDKASAIGKRSATTMIGASFARSNSSTLNFRARLSPTLETQQPHLVGLLFCFIAFTWPLPALIDIG
jgi:hypothetical protein